MLVSQQTPEELKFGKLHETEFTEYTLYQSRLRMCSLQRTIDFADIT